MVLQHSEKMIEYIKKNQLNEVFYTVFSPLFKIKERKCYWFRLYLNIAIKVSKAVTMNFKVLNWFDLFLVLHPPPISRQHSFNAVQSRQCEYNMVVIRSGPNCLFCLNIATLNILHYDTCFSWELIYFQKKSSLTDFKYIQCTVSYTKFVR